MENHTTRWRALLLLFLAMVTDVIDGPLARYRGEVSQLGQVLDPISDKLFLNAVVVRLSQQQQLPWWITSLFLSRDVGIVLAGLFFYSRKADIMISQTAGKAMTVVLTVAILLHFAFGTRISRPVFYVALALGVLSVWQYGSNFIALIHP